MRIAVSADDANGLDSITSPHFGRCPVFILVDVEGKTIEKVSAVQNPFYGAHRPGAVPGFINEQGADVMLTGGMGARAVQFFRQFGIQPVTGASGNVRMALEAYLGGDLQGAAPCATSQEHGQGVEATGYEQDALGRLREEAESAQAQLDAALRKIDELRQER